MADLVIALLQDYAAATALFPLRPAELDSTHRDLPEPALLGDWDNAPASCVHGGPLHLAALPSTVPLTLSVSPFAHALICMESLHCLQEICTADGRGHWLKALYATPMLSGICTWHRYFVSCRVHHVREHYVQAPVREPY